MVIRSLTVLFERLKKSSGHTEVAVV